MRAWFASPASWMALLLAMLAAQVVWASPPVAYQAWQEDAAVSYPAVPRPSVGSPWAAPGPRPNVAVCPRCRHRGCICVPAAESFGYFTTLWRSWPFEPRPDQDFPQAIGAERVPAPRGEPPKPMPVVDFNKLTPPEEVPTPEEPAESTELPGTPWKTPNSAAPRTPEPLFPEKRPGNEGVLPPASATPMPLPDDRGTPALKPVVPEEHTEYRASRADQLFALDSADSLRKPVRDAGLAGVLVAPAPSELPVSFSEDAPAMRMIPSASEADRPAPDRLARGVWDTRERALTVPVGYAEALPAPVAPAAEPPSTPEIRLTVGPAAATVPLQGLCPVELIEHGQAAPGSADCAVEQGGLSFHCAGPEQQRKFWAHPERYLPTFSGVDPVLRHDRQETTASRGDVWAVYNGRLYLFSSEANLAQFRHNPALYAERR